MFHVRTLDVYGCAVELLPKAYSSAELVDGEMASQLRRAALSINLNIAVLDAMATLGISAPHAADAEALLVRIVSMLTKMISSADPRAAPRVTSFWQVTAVTRGVHNLPASLIHAIMVHLKSAAWVQVMDRITT